MFLSAFSGMGGFFNLGKPNVSYACLPIVIQNGCTIEPLSRIDTTRGCEAQGGQGILVWSASIHKLCDNKDEVYATFYDTSPIGREIGGCNSRFL